MNLANGWIEDDDAAEFFLAVLTVRRRFDGDHLGLLVDLPEFGPWWFACEGTDRKALPNGYPDPSEDARVEVVDVRVQS